MTFRSFSGHPATITFTSDSHALLYGDLRRGEPLTIRYDPQRIVPAGETYMFGDPERPVYAHVQFSKGGSEISRVLVSASGTVAQPDLDEMGQGSMLDATVQVPQDADFVEVWFHFEATGGESVWDNGEGNNYWFRFPFTDLELLSIQIHPLQQAGKGELAIEIAALPEVENLSIRFLVLNTPECPKSDVELQRSGKLTPGGKQIWVLPESGPHCNLPVKAIVRFKIYYWIDGRRYKDDNSSRYYIGPLREETPAPPPPDELRKAAKAW